MINSWYFYRKFELSRKYIETHSNIEAGSNSNSFGHILVKNASSRLT